MRSETTLRGNKPHTHTHTHTKPTREGKHARTHPLPFPRAHTPTHLALQGLIRVLQAVNDSHLVLRGVLGVVLDDGCQPCDTQVLQVVVVRLDEAGDGAGSGVQQHGVRVDGGHRAHTLVDDGVADGNARVCAAHDLQEHLVHPL